MAFVTVEREPHPELSELEQLEYQDGDESTDISSKVTKSSRSKSQNEDFFAYKGAALGLKQSQCRRKFSCLEGNDELQDHLRKILSIIRNNDCLKLVVKLQSNYAAKDRHRYLVILCTVGIQDTEEYAILGIDIAEDDTITIGLVLEIWMGMTIELNGDGGFKTVSKESVHLFKPVSVQAMWAAIQNLDHSFKVAKANNYHPKGLTHTWIGYYKRSVAQSSLSMMKEWNYQEDLEGEKSLIEPGSIESETVMKSHITSQLKRVMLTVDLENVTVRELRQKLEDEFRIDLSSYRKYIESETLRIYGQMDSPSQIFDHLYLGSMFNASNLEELERNNVTHILNVTREIDNFFLDRFVYKNIRVWDEEKSDLLPYWEDAYKFINSAKENGTRVLVHCKMGVSRSASTVIAYAMKEYNWPLDQAIAEVKKKRSCIQPNPGFMIQLKTYEGILQASRHRHNHIFRHSSDPSKTYSYRKSMEPFENIKREPYSESDDDAQLDKPSEINLDQEIFMFKSASKQKESRSVSVLSNISNKSQIIAERSNPSTNSAPASCHDPVTNESGIGVAIVVRSDAIHVSNRRTFSQRASGKKQSSKDNHDSENAEPEQIIEKIRASSMTRKYEEQQNESMKFEEFSSKIGDLIMKTQNSPKLSSAHSDPCLASPSNYYKPIVFDDEKENQMSQTCESQGHDYYDCPDDSSSLTRLKIRPDNSWIRDNSELMCCQPQRKSDIITRKAPSYDDEDPVFSLDMSDDKIPLSNQQSHAAYSKEQIPWNSGTVKQLSGELEFKIRRTRSQSGSVNEMISPASEEANSPHEQESSASPPDRTFQQRDQVVSKIYESERISYEPGLVKRTKQVFSSNNSSQSLSNLNEASLNINRSQKKPLKSEETCVDDVYQPNKLHSMSVSPAVSDGFPQTIDHTNNSFQSNYNNNTFTSDDDCFMDVDGASPDKIIIQSDKQSRPVSDSSLNVYLSDGTVLQEESNSDRIGEDTVTFSHEPPLVRRISGGDDVVQDSIRPVRELVGHFSWNCPASDKDYQSRKTRTRNKRPFSSGEQIDFHFSCRQLDTIVVDGEDDSDLIRRHLVDESSPQNNIADSGRKEDSIQAPLPSGSSTFGNSQFYCTM